jgi:putative salt-induced outer membrane protein YdiY
MMNILSLLAATVATAAPETHIPNPIPTLAQDAAAVEEPAWNGSVNVGASVTNGNTKITRANVAVDAQKEIEGDYRQTFGLWWNYGEETGNITERRAGGKYQYDKFIDDDSYYLGQASAETDDNAGVDLRTTLGVGYGQKLVQKENLTVDGEIGVSYFNESFAEKDAAGEDAFDYIAARLAANTEYAYSEKISFSNGVQIFPSLEDTDDVYAKLDTRAKATLTENMFGQLQWIWEWDNTPAPGLKRSDNQVLLTIGWNF